MAEGRAVKDEADVASRNRSPRWPLRGLIAVIALQTIVHALAPTLLEEAPILLALLDGRTSSLILLSQTLSVPALLLCAPIGMVLGNPFAYALGRYDGARATFVLGRWMPTTGVILQKAEQLMKRWNGAPVVVLFGYVGSAVAGAAEVSVGWFAFFNAVGIAIRIMVVIIGTNTFDGQADALGSWVSENTLALTVLTASLVLLDLYRGRRRRATASKG